MKYIKILFSIGVLFLLILLLHFGTQIVMFDFWYDNALLSSDKLYFKEKTYFISQFVQMMMFFAVLYGSLGLWHMIKQQYYNLKTFKYFNISGLFFIITASLDLMMGVLNFSVSKVEHNLVMSIASGFSFIVLGLGLMAISKILIDGLEIKTENDLTI